MIARKALFSAFGRPMIAATIAAVAVTTVAPSFAHAGPLPGKRESSVAASDATDISARRRFVRGNGAAAAAVFAGIVGTGIAVAAAQNRRAYYDSYYGGPAYYSGPGYYGEPVYASPQPYYDGGPAYYRHSGVPHFRGHPLASW